MLVTSTTSVTSVISSSFSKINQLQKVTLQGCCLTTNVFDRATDSIHIDGSTSFNLQSTLLHDTGSVVLDAVAEITGIVRVTGYLHTIHVELSINVTASRSSGHGQSSQVSHLSLNIIILLSEERRGQSGAGPDINRNWKMRSI